MGHIQVELLSALADGELDLSTMREIQPHLAQCGDCSVRLNTFRGLDQVLAAPAPLTCASSRELRSALLDEELSAAESTVAGAHLAECPACQNEQAAWSTAQLAIAALPQARPSARLDARVARLTAPAPDRRIPFAPPAFAGLAARGAVAAAVVLAILVGLLPGAPASAPEQAAVEQPSTQSALVAGVQLVLYDKTNTLYVLQPRDAAVDAVDASTYALVTRIAVGGKPSALAIDQAASRVLVLDSSAKSLVEIDADRNVVVSTTFVPVSGTPTGVQVDASTGKIVVSSVADVPESGSGRPSPTPQGAGQVAVLDGTTKNVEVVRSVDVAPRLIITDPSGKGALIVGSSATTYVDKLYQPVRTLPGGVSATFGATGNIAVLGRDGAGSILHLLFGDLSPAPLRLTGTPLSVTSLPDGGFAVLLGSGTGNGRIVVIDGAGAPVGTTAVDVVGTDLTYDRSTKRFAIAAGGRVVAAELPSGVVAEAPVRTDTPSVSGAPQRVAPAVSPVASPSAAPSAAPSASPVVAAKPTAPAVPSQAAKVGEGVFRLSTDGLLPLLTASSATRLWYVDQRNALNAVDVWNGAMYTLAVLPADARIRALAADERHVFALDITAGRLYTLDVGTERVSRDDLALFRYATALTVDATGRAWIASGRTPELFMLDPVTKRLEVVDIGLTAQVIRAEGDRAIWYSDGARQIGVYDLRTERITTVALPSKGAAYSLLPEGSGVWVGTTAGEIFWVRGLSATLVATATGPITELTAEPSGSVWYLATTPSGSRFTAVGTANSLVLPGLAISAQFNPVGRALLADPAGGIYLLVTGAR